MYIKSYKQCKHCSREIVSSRLKVHENKCLEQQQEKIRPKKKGHPIGYIPWNKGLTKDNDERVKKNSESVAATMQQKVKDGTYIPIKNSDEWKERLSIRQSVKNSGGRCKWFEYEGVYLQGTWELSIAKKLNELSMKWIKVTKPWSYVDDNGIFRKYTPDLFLEDENIFLEIKGYWWGNDKRKMELVVEQHPDKRIVLIEKEQYEKIMLGELVW